MPPRAHVCAAFGGGYSYICEPMGVFRDHVNTYVAAEYAAGGDLFLWMTQGVRHTQTFSRSFRESVVADVVSDLGVAHMRPAQRQASSYRMRLSRPSRARAECAISWSGVRGSAHAHAGGWGEGQRRGGPRLVRGHASGAKTGLGGEGGEAEVEATAATL